VELELEGLRGMAAVKIADEERRLTILQGFMPPPTSAARPTEALLQAIAQTRQKVTATTALSKEITAAIEHLRKATP
jgi:hypothetical protein